MRGKRDVMADIRVPTLGESVTEATVGKWFKKPGDAVAVDEPLVELETDKVTLEVPAPAAGVLGDIAVKEGDTVGPQDGGGNRRRSFAGFRHGCARSGHQRRHDGGDRALRRAADAGRRASA